MFESVSFAISEQELLTVTGANGSGKTSLLKALVGLVPLEAGSLYWRGQKLAHDRYAMQSEIAWWSHRVEMKAELSIEENLQYEASLRPQRNIAIMAVLEQLGLSHLAEMPLGMLSAGQQRRAGLARMILADVALWIMDEPFTNLDTVGRQTVSTVIDEHLMSGGACMVATHHTMHTRATARSLELS